MSRIPIALQLYSVREDAARDLQGVLAAVADMGYEGVEFAGYYGHDAQTIRTWLDAYGLKVAGAHVGIDTLLGDELARTVAFHQTIGNTTLIVPGLAEQWRNSRAAWLKTAETLNAIAGALKPYGMRTGYHNHHIEFVPMEGELPWDTLFSNTTDDVIMQFDTGNALHGGAQAAPFLRRYPKRAKTVHLKEYSATNDAALIGEGDVPWTEIFELCETIGGTEWYIVEQESYAYPPLECARRCLQALKAMGK
ncbi:sugar phosphate isomerase/epimerase family protein [Roseiflexus sp.]|uniref:sugar phosphate isomerase/epimerase family protein n=1 Tax=Roseiflexus sp. TaxID=2562120 RepID=UPI00398B2727